MSLKIKIISAFATLGRILAVCGFIFGFIFLIARIMIADLNNYRQIAGPPFSFFNAFVLNTDWVDLGIQTTDGKDLKYVSIEGRNVLVVVDSKNHFFNAPRGGTMHVSLYREKEYRALIQRFGLTIVDNRLLDIEFEEALLVQSINFKTLAELCFGIGILGLVLIPLRYKGVVATRF